MTDAFGMALGARRVPPPIWSQWALGAVGVICGLLIWFLPSLHRMMLWGALAAFCFALIPLMWREGYTWVIIWLAPVATLDPVPMSTLRIAKYVLVALAIAIALSKRRLWPQTKSAFATAPLWAALLLLAWLWIRAITGNQPLAGAAEAFRLTAVAGLAYMWLSEPARAGGRRRWYTLWMLMGVYQFAACVVESILFGKIRSYGTLANANALGTYLILTIAIAFATALWAPTRRVRVLSWSTLLILLVALYSTGSRAAWLATVVTMLTVVLVSRSWRTLILGGVVFGTVALFYATNPVFRYTADAALRLEMGLTHRPILWEAADRATSKSLWIGHGLDGGGEEMDREARYPSVIHRAMLAGIMKAGSPHSFYREMLVEAGLIGLLLTAALVALILRECWRARRSSDRWRGTYALALLGATIGVLVHSYFERSVLLGSMSMAVFYWFLVVQTLRADDPGDLGKSLTLRRV